MNLHKLFPAFLLLFSITTQYAVSSELQKNIDDEEFFNLSPLEFGEIDWDNLFEKYDEIKETKEKIVSNDLPSKEEIKNLEEEYKKAINTEQKIENDIKNLSLRETKKNYINGFKSYWRENQDNYLKGLFSICKEKAPQTIRLKYIFENYLNKNLEIEENKKDSILNYICNIHLNEIMNEKYKEINDYIEIKKQSYNHHEKSHVDLLHKLGLNGQGAPLIIIESDLYTTNSHGHKTVTFASEVAPGTHIFYGIEENFIKEYNEHCQNYKNFPDRNDQNYEKLKIEYWSKVNKDWFESLNSEEKRIISDIYTPIFNACKTANDKNMFPHVINVSLEKFTTLLKGRHLDKLTELLEEKDMLLVFSAGNEPTSVPDHFKDLFDKYPLLKKRLIFVGSTDMFGDVSYFSTTPGNFDDMFIYAPGQSLTFYDDVLKENTYIEGTSFAAPQVAAFFALLKKYFPDQNMISLKNIVLSNTSPFSKYMEGYQDKKIVGCGQLNAYKAFLGALKESEGHQNLKRKYEEENFQNNKVPKN